MKTLRIHPADDAVESAVTPERIAAWREDQSAVNDVQRPNPLDVSPVCAACKGVCCTEVKGRNLFQGREDDVMQYLPLSAVDGSCIFHTLQGCAVPHDERPDVCRRYFCAPLRNVDAGKYNLIAGAEMQTVTIKEV